jgi:hypothetical protein
MRLRGFAIQNFDWWTFVGLTTYGRLLIIDGHHPLSGTHLNHLNHRQADMPPAFDGIPAINMLFSVFSTYGRWRFGQGLSTPESK